MSFYSVDNKIVSVEGKFPERKVNTLTFEVAGTQFPDPYLNINDSRNHFYFDSLGSNSVIVNWGDGVIETFDFGTDFISNGQSRIGWIARGTDTDNNILVGDTNAGRHIYQDGFNGIRVITFTFKDLSAIIQNIVNFTHLYNLYPENIGFAENIKIFFLNRSSFINALPDSLIINNQIEEITLQDAFPAKFNRIPDSFFNKPLIFLSVSGSFNLSDIISSNFFKINQLKSSLEYLYLEGCDIVELPVELSECEKITDLRLANNSITNPEVVEPLFNLERLYISVDSSAELFETSNFLDLRFFWLISLNSTTINQIPEKWRGLKSLVSFVIFENVITNDTDFDLFIDAFYQLCTENGFLHPTSTEAINTGFPEQFRDISWGHSSLTQTGAIQAPAGFVQGSNNGTPVNQGEKIYVLVNNYGHTVTTA